jgi:hypothetical protein
LVAPNGSLLDAAAPTQIPGWDQLARGQSFYLSADWLAFADTDQVASSQYLGSFDGERLTAALSSHWAPAEIDPGYVAAEALELPANPCRVLTLGGRRGFASGVLVAPGLRRQAAADQLARLIRRARLRRQAELLGSRAVVFACFDGDDIVGFALAYQWGGELALRVVGFDYERLPGADEYAQLAVHAPMRFCYQRGFRRLHLGTESYQAKCRRGARARPLWAVTSSPNPAAITREVRRIAAALPAHEAAAFTNQAQQAWRGWTE